MDKNTLRIFSFCGGGTKGYGSNRFMQKFLQEWGIPQADFWKYADVMCGTSIGAILASGYSFGKTPDYMESFFLNDAKIRVLFIIKFVIPKNFRPYSHAYLLTVCKM
mgnify:CR=1 FL=1